MIKIIVLGYGHSWRTTKGGWMSWEKYTSGSARWQLLRWNRDCSVSVSSPSHIIQTETELLVCLVTISLCLVRFGSHLLAAFSSSWDLHWLIASTPCLSTSAVLISLLGKSPEGHCLPWCGCLGFINLQLVPTLRQFCMFHARLLGAFIMYTLYHLLSQKK